jgi:sec-independent protein translocase protein TatB
MFDFAWSEIVVIAVVALVVIGPKDLPKVLRTVGMWVSRARAIAREFQGSLDQMIREAELEEVRKQVEQAGSASVGNVIERTVDPHGELAKSFAEPPIPTETPPAPAETLPPPADAAGTEAASAPPSEPARPNEPASEAAAIPPAKSGTNG